jgi:hypothetical protein
MKEFGWDPSFAKAAAAASADRVSGQVIQDDMVAGICPEISVVIGRMTSPQPLAALLAGFPPHAPRHLSAPKQREAARC